MTLDLGLEPILDVSPIELAWFGPVIIKVENGQAGAPVQIMIGFNEVRQKLKPLIDGTLLVAPVAGAISGQFDAMGRLDALLVDFNDPSLLDLQVSMQAASLNFGDANQPPSVSLSQGMTVSIKGLPNPGGESPKD